MSEQIITEKKHGFNYINQKDKIWQKYRYAGDKPKNNACGPFVLTMALEIILKKEINVIDVMKFAEENYYDEDGTSWDFFCDFCKKYNIFVKEIIPNKKEFIEAINKNKLVIFSQNNKLNNYWTTQGHYILIVKKTENDKFVVLDTASRKRTNKLYNFDEIFIPCKRMWILSK